MSSAVIKWLRAQNSRLKSSRTRTGNAPGFSSSTTRFATSPAATTIADDESSDGSEGTLIHSSSDEGRPRAGAASSPPDHREDGNNNNNNRDYEVVNPPATIVTTPTTEHSESSVMRESSEGQEEDESESVTVTGLEFGPPENKSSVVQIDESSAAPAEAQGSSSEQDDEAGPLQKQLWQAREQRDALDAQLAQRTRELSKRQSELFALEKSQKMELAKALQQQKEDLTADTGSRIRELEAGLEIMSEELRMFQRESGEVQQRCSVLGLQVNRMSQELQDRDDRIEKLEMEVKTLKETRERITAQFQHTQAVKNSVQAKAEATQAQLRHTISLLKAELKERDTQIASLKTDMEFHRLALSDRANVVNYLNASLQAEKQQAKEQTELDSTRLLYMRERMKHVVDRMETWRREEFNCIEECQNVVNVLNGIVEEVSWTATDRRHQPFKTSHHFFQHEQNPTAVRCDTSYVNKNAHAHSVQSIESPQVHTPAHAEGPWYAAATPTDIPPTTLPLAPAAEGHEYQDSAGSDDEAQEGDDLKFTIAPTALASPTPPPPRTSSVFNSEEHVNTNIHGLSNRSPRSRLPSSQTFGRPVESDAV
ncbi:hypothetical protein DFJ77DRAFT_26741 [Powellomyces hirtus]|nr:hypothetical protein DFJ77DRAFT_26741 [Powellomyces hirtus]